MFVISFRVRVCVFLFSSSFSEEQSAVRPREICFPFAWQAGETKPYGKNVSPYDISICLQVGGKRTGGQGWKYRKGAWQVLCSNGVLLPEKLRWNGKRLLAYLSVTACGLTANLAFRICLRIKEFTDFCDHIKANIWYRRFWPTPKEKWHCLYTLSVYKHSRNISFNSVFMGSVYTE